MRSNEKIIKALRCCAKYMDEGLCEECPLFGQDDCGERVLLEAANALELAEQQLDYGKEAMDVLVKESLVMEQELAELRKGRASCAG